jgi:hypothetical protein
MAEPIKARWHGVPPDDPRHEYVNGVAARDLTEAEYRALPADLKTKVRNAVQARNGRPLYTVRPDAELHPPPAEPAPEPSRRRGATSEPPPARGKDGG